MTYISNQDFMLEVAKGNIAGHSVVNKFGHNPVVTNSTTEDIWDGGGTYSFPATADITHVRQVVDQAAMQSQNIEVQGLDTNWDLTVQTVTLDAANTTTPVALTTALRRVFRMKVMANVVADQDIELRNVGGGTTYAIIGAGNNQTLMAIYTVPNGKTAYIVSFYADSVKTSVQNPDSVEFQLWFADRDNGYEFQLKNQSGLPDGAGELQHFFKPYYKATQKTDIKLTATPEGKNVHVNGGFDIILVDN
jgi:hypothetical protein